MTRLATKSPLPSLSSSLAHCSTMSTNTAIRAPKLICSIDTFLKISRRIMQREPIMKIWIQPSHKNLKRMEDQIYKAHKREAQAPITWVPMSSYLLVARLLLRFAKACKAQVRAFLRLCWAHQMNSWELAGTRIQNRWRLLFQSVPAKDKLI